MPYKDPAKQREYQRNWMRGRTTAKEYNRAYKKVRADKITQYLIEHPCVTCGEADLDVLDFHHVNPELREFGVGTAQAWERTIVEIEKCVVLCANCHRRVHGIMRRMGL